MASGIAGKHLAKRKEKLFSCEKCFCKRSFCDNVNVVVAGRNGFDLWGEQIIGRETIRIAPDC